MESYFQLQDNEEAAKDIIGQKHSLNYTRSEELIQVNNLPNIFYITGKSF
jgi:hypothetical protein